MVMNLTLGHSVGLCERKVGKAILEQEQLSELLRDHFKGSSRHLSSSGPSLGACGAWGWGAQ